VVSVLGVNDTFTAAVENDIAKQLNEMHAYMVLTNPNVSTPGSGTATWVTMGNVTVPTWATKARVCLSMTGIRANTNPTGADLAVKIGSSTGTTKRISLTDTVNRGQAGFNDQLTSVPTGSQSVTVQATFGAGTLLAPSTFCSFDLNIDWMQ
jgi:hypothetical protein